MEKRWLDWRLLAGKQRLIAAVMVAFSGLLLFSFGGLVLNAYHLNRQADGLRQEIKALQADNEKLQKEATYLQSDEGLEKLAREQLGWTKPGETGVVAVPSKNQDHPNTSPPPPPRRETPNWQRWWNLFFGK